MTEKKFLVIFRGINVDYFDPSTTKLESDEDNLFKSWELEVGKKIYSFTRKINSMERTRNIFRTQLIKLILNLGYEAFIAVILGSDQGRDLI